MAPARVVMFRVVDGGRALSTDRLDVALAHRRRFGGRIVRELLVAGAVETETGRLVRTGGEGS